MIRINCSGVIKNGEFHPNPDAELGRACTTGDADLAEKAIASGANVNSQVDGVPLIIKVVKESFLAIARLLVKNNVDTQVRDKQGRTPALLAFDYEGGYKPGFDSLFPRTDHDSKYFAFNILSLIFNNSSPMTMEGSTFHPGSISIDFTEYLHDCFEQFKGFDFFKYLKITESEVDQISAALLCDLSNYDEADMVEKIRSGELCFLKTGWEGHAIQIVFFGNYMAICNRGEGSEDRNTIEVHNIDPLLISSTNLIPILDENLSEMDVVIGTKLVYETFPALIGGSQNDIFIQKCEDFQPKPQQHENCTISSTKAAIRFAWAMLLTKQGISIEEAIGHATKESKLFTDYIANYVFGEFSIYFPNRSLPKPILESHSKKQARFFGRIGLFDHT